MKKFVVNFKEVDKHDISSVGGKGANLGEMTKIGIPVPGGFIVTAESYYNFLDVNGLREKITSTLKNLDVSNSQDLEDTSIRVQKLIEGEHIPKEIADEIIRHYTTMGRIFHDPYVAIRSSATAEDLPTASFAGQQATYLNIKGEASVVYHVRKCWASLFTARAIFYRVENKFDHLKVGIAVPVQKMVQSEKSGIMFTINPVTGEKKTMVIEATFGLGELIVQGAVTPDHYEIDKHTLEILHKKVNIQEKYMVLKKGKTIIDYVKSSIRDKQKITDAQIVKLAHIGKTLERHYYYPQDIEWAVEDDKIYITQTRPITTMESSSKTYLEQKGDRHEVAHTHVVLLQGDPASPGIASGPVRIVKSVKEINSVKKGEILVAPQTNPDYVPAMRKVVGIITETGGRTSHAAIVSRELGIPAVVGVVGALKKLTNGQIITIHGSRGVIYKGGIYKSAGLKSDSAQISSLTPGVRKVYVPHKTATKVYVNLAEPERAIDTSKRHVDGVGLLRAEFMIAGIGTHPKKFIKEKKQTVFVNELARGLASFCEAFYPRPVVYRATDFRTNEYRNLKGGDEFEPTEANPMLGFRGCFRYITDPNVFELELEAIKHVRNKQGLKNLWLMIPFVHTPEEFAQVKKIIASNGLSRNSSFKLWMMVEIPSNVILLEEFLNLGIDGVSIGSNDLTMLILGVDRDNSDVASVFNERNPAVMWAIEHVIKTCQKHNVTSSICGQAPSDYPELVEKLIKWGITSISVNRDVIDQVRDTIYNAELKLIK